VKIVLYVRHLKELYDKNRFYPYNTIGWIVKIDLKLGPGAGWPDWANLDDCLFWTVLFYFGLFYENYKSSPNLLCTFYNGNNNVLLLTKKGWATYWANFHKLIWSPWPKAEFFKWDFMPMGKINAWLNLAPRHILNLPRVKNQPWLLPTIRIRSKFLPSPHQVPPVDGSKNSPANN
jgi:hypothetical protein